MDTALAHPPSSLYFCGLIFKKGNSVKERPIAVIDEIITECADCLSEAADRRVLIVEIWWNGFESVSGEIEEEVGVGDGVRVWKRCVGQREISVGQREMK